MSHSGREGLRGISTPGDLSKIEEVRRENKKLKQRERDRLNRKYHLEERGTMYVSGMLKQKIKAGGMKIKKDMMKDANSSSRTICFEPIRSCFTRH